jgi:hypothetical protein
MAPSQEIEVLEQWARALARAGHGAEALALVDEALALATRHREPTRRLRQTRAACLA